MGKNSLRLRPLSSAELKEKIQVTQGFGNISSHLHLPLDTSISLATIKGLLDEAASYSILIKQFLEKTKTGGKPIRLIPGSGREYLKNLETFPEDPDEFVRDLVHATFTTKTGYIAKTSKEEIDRLLDRLFAGKTRKNSVPKEELRRIEKGIRDTWGETSQTMAQILSFFDHTSFSNPEYASTLHRLLHALQSARQQASTFHQKVVLDMKEAHEDAHDDSQSEGSSAEMEKDDEATAPQLSVEEEKSQQQKESEITVTTDELEPPKPAPEEPAAPAAAAAPAAEQPAPSPSPDPNAMKIRRIASEVGHIGEEIQSISHNVQVLNVDDLISKPSEGKKLVSDLQHRCLAFSESLMKDLYSLDELALKQEERPKRKEQVQRIQSMVADVDNLTTKLHELVELMKAEEQKRMAEEPPKPAAATPAAEEKRPEEPKQAPREQEAPKESPTPTEELQMETLKRQKEAEAEEAVQKRMRAERELEFQKRKEEFEAKLADQAIRLEGMWRRMKLRPKLNVEEAVDGYLITSYIPGMKKEEIFISTSPDHRNPVLSIRGHRSPTLEELALMRRQLARSGIQPTDEAILRLGAGRFGTFLEKFAIPRDVDAAGIAGGYEGGELKVILPKIRVQPLRRPVPQPYFDPTDFWF